MPPPTLVNGVRPAPPCHRGPATRLHHVMSRIAAIRKPVSMNAGTSGADADPPKMLLLLLLSVLSDPESVPELELLDAVLVCVWSARRLTMTAPTACAPRFASVVGKDITVDRRSVVEGWSLSGGRCEEGSCKKAREGTRSSSCAAGARDNNQQSEE